MCMYVFAHIKIHSMAQYSWKIPHANDVCCVFLILISSGAQRHMTLNLRVQIKQRAQKEKKSARDMLFAGASSLAGV